MSAFNRREPPKNHLGNVEKMKLSHFQFSLPRELVAGYPAEPRDSARLMVVHRDTGKIEHRVFKELDSYLNPQDSLAINDTRVYSARLYGRKEKTGAKIKIMLLRKLDTGEHDWDVLVEPARKIRVGNKVFFGDGLLAAEVLDNTTSRGRTMTFQFDGSYEEFMELVEKIGTTPLPGAIGREAEEEDKDRYQTVYADKLGAVTAPSAGLHFTRVLKKRIEMKDVVVAPITLHMGMGSHRPVDVEDLSKFRMGSENYIIPPSSAQAINDSRKAGKQIIAVGVSTAKALESNVSVQGALKVQPSAWTNLFIFPPYQFRICTGLITNFHIPQSTMLMLVCAFGGYDCIMNAYEVAIKERYRFFNYGDAMLII